MAYVVDLPATLDGMEACWKQRGGQPVPGTAGDRARILLAGDTHGNLDWVSTLCKLATRFDAQGVVQLGDFGMWSDSMVLRRERRVEPNEGWMDAVAERCARRGVWIRFVDGNHDAHPLYRSYPTAADGIRPIRHRIIDWADRGAVWEWNGVRFGALGGAISVDRRRRREGIDLWSATEITSPVDVDALVERAGQAGVDVLLAHDSPVLPDGVRPLPAPVDDPYLPADCATNIEVVADAVNRTRPTLVVHGHYRTRWTGTIGSTRVEGLESGQHGASWAILDIADGRWQWIDSKTASQR